MKQLFKYMSTPRSVFSEGYIRLSQPAALNDPFEGSYCSKSLDELAENFDDAMAHDREFGNISFSQYVDFRKNNIGVLSFSENKENLLMWAHYADDHRGLILGVNNLIDSVSIFDNLFRADTLINSSWSEEYSPFDGVPKPVLYRKGLRYRNDKFDYDYSNIDAEGADRILYEIFTQKSDEWIYEQEHRVILRLEQADRVVLPSLDIVEEKRLKEKIEESNHAHVDPISGSCIVRLNEITNDAERMYLAMGLTELSAHTRVIYMMKLNSSSINNCLFGLNCSLMKVDVEGGYASSTGYLDIWKAKRNNEYYSLEFDQL